MNRAACLVIDDLYPDPVAVRECALALEYADADNDRDKRYYKGLLSTPHHPYASFGLDLIAGALSREAIAPSPVGEFRLLPKPKENDPLDRTWIHTDISAAPWSGLVFLNLPGQCQGGLAFYRHREFGISRLPAPNSREAWALMLRFRLHWHEILDRLTGDGFDVEEKWERTDTVSMAFNRAVVFDACYFHARTSTFGETKPTARLTQNYFFHLCRHLPVRHAGCF